MSAKNGTGTLDQRIVEAKRVAAGPALDGLTAKQRRFVEEFPIDLNATAAAKRAGYSENSASDIGFQLLRNEKIINAMASVLAARSHATKIDRAWVLTNLVSAHDQAKAKGDTLGGIANRLKALELIGRHVDVRAFRAGVGFSGGDDDGALPLWDLSQLDDEEFDEFDRLLRKISVSRPHGEGAPNPRAAARFGKGESAPGGDSVGL